MTTEVAAHSLFAGPDRGTARKRRAPARRRPHHLHIASRRAARHRPALLRPSRLRQRPRPRAPDRVLVRRASTCPWKAGSCAPRSARRPIPTSTAASALARSARAGCARDDDPLHPAERHHAAGRGGQSDRARAPRRRHPHRLRARGARPEPGRLWRQRTGAVRPLRRRPQHRSSNCSSGPPMSPRAYIELTETRSPRKSRAQRSTCSSARPACNGARRRCWKPSPKTPRGPAAASTCICWRPSISAPGPTSIFPMASCAISATSAFCRTG